MTLSEILRFYFIVRTFLNYGIDDRYIPKMRIAILLRILRYILFWIPSHRYKKQQLGCRLRLALQDLGPVWVKLGQMLSTRHDLFSSQIINQLSLLQDKVSPFDGVLAKQQIEKAMGNLPISTWFKDFSITPLASASISQVHTARLKKNCKEVVIKVIRPDILPIIKADIKLIYRIANWIPCFWPGYSHLKPVAIVREYEKTLINELNLLREAANTIQLRHNFENSPMLYIPEVYYNYCSKNMMVMEYVCGIPVSDIESLKQNGTNMKLLAERGVQIFFTQVFRDSFFHADMHPGNIFVNFKHPDNPQYIGIDCGIIGILNKDDKRYLAENFIAFFNRDYRRVAELHINSGWISSNTNVEEFECSIRTVCEPIFEKPLVDISFYQILMNLFSIARRFNMEIQPQLILLQKTLFYVEGIGRRIYPQLDLWKTAKPFLESWLYDQVGLPALVRVVKKKLPFWIEKIPEIPELVYNNLQQGKDLQYCVNKISCKQKHKQSDRQDRLCYWFSIGAILLLSGAIIFINREEQEIVSLCLMICGILIWLTGWLI